MTMDELRHFFGWCAVLNYALLILWFLLYIAVRPLFVAMCRRFFNISEETFDSCMFYGISFYKLSVILFTIMPYFALWIMKK